MSQHIDSPQTGEHITFLTTARESNGALLRMEIEMDPGGFVAGEHIHPQQEERFEILAGRVRMRIDGIERDAIEGDVIVVPRGSPHVWWNPTSRPARVLADLRPALRTQELREILAVWMSEGMTRAGMPVNPLRLAALAREYRNEVQTVHPKSGLGRLATPMRSIAVIVLAAIARLVGIEATTRSGAPRLRYPA